MPRSYPHDSLLLRSLKGERWKDIPGLEDYFKVSNMGRVRRLAYETIYKNGAIYQKEEKIIKPQVVTVKNAVLGSNRFLVTRVTLSGVRHTITLARYVYCCFVRPFDLDDKAILILCKDGDGLNVHPGNLYMTSPAGRAQRMIKKGRYVSGYSRMRPDKRARIRERLLEVNSRQISQYGPDGKRIRTFRSAAEAQRITGVSQVSIRQVVAGANNTAGNYIWKEGTSPRIDPAKDREEKKRRHRQVYGRKVTQYDLRGNRISTFPSFQDAQERTGVDANRIRLVLKGTYKSAGGFLWTKGYGQPSIDIRNYSWGDEAKALAHLKPVCQMTDKGKVLSVFPSVKAAAAHAGVTSNGIVAACKGRQATSGGYRWKYASRGTKKKKAIPR